jgi:hypothetical protein
MLVRETVGTRFAASWIQRPSASETKPGLAGSLGPVVGIRPAPRLVHPLPLAAGGFLQAVGHLYLPARSAVAD